MKNSTLGSWLVGTTVATVLLAIIEAGSPDSAMSTLLGIGFIAMLVFAIWGGMRLTKLDN